MKRLRGSYIDPKEGASAFSSIITRKDYVKNFLESLGDGDVVSLHPDDYEIAVKLYTELILRKRLRMIPPMEQEKMEKGSDGSTSHYGSVTDPYEVIKVLDAWGVDAYQFNIIKYVARHRRKDGLKDLKKALFYLSRYISNEENKEKSPGVEPPPPSPKKNDFCVMHYGQATYTIRRVVKDISHSTAKQGLKLRLQGLSLTQEEANYLFAFYNLNAYNDAEIWNEILTRVGPIQKT
jgi:uncharacterized protein DUF3310